MTDSPTRAAPAGLNRFATHGHHRLSYEFVPAAPPSRRPAAPPVVLLHALLAGRAEFADLRAALGDNFPLILPDARGHGASAGLADQRYSVAEMVSELAAVLADAGGETGSVHLIGHELGALVALAFAQANPGQVRSLTLIEATLPSILDLKRIDPASATEIAAEQAADETAAETAYKGLGDRAVDQYLTPRRGSNWRDHVSKPRLATIRRNAGSLAGLLAAVNTFDVPTDALSRLEIPTLILSGTASRPAVRLTGERLAALIPAAQAVVIPTNTPDESLIASPHVAAVIAAVRGLL